MGSDGNRPAGEDAASARRWTDHEIGPMREPSPDGPQVASTFVGRVSQLSVEAVRAAVQAWHDVMRVESDAWFAAEQAAGQAVLAAARSGVQEVLLDRIAECVLRGVWYRDANMQPQGTPENRVGATEASGQYVATVAMLALLVRDRLAPSAFALLYRPFATVIPVEELQLE
jgi:hypothetical protein